MRLFSLFFILVSGTLPCLSQTSGAYTIDTCPDTTRACIVAYTSLDGSYTNGLTTHSYFDGFGRLVQSVALSASPDGGDLAALTEYDGFGRLTRQWLQAKCQGSGGHIDPDVLKGLARQAYTDNMPYSETAYEPSPLSRPLSETGPGAAWHNSGKAAGRKYLANSISADSLVCRRYTATQTSACGMAVSCAGTYPAGTLSVVRSEDEDGHATFEFRDRQGRTVLTRRREDGGGGGFCDTYFIYSGLGLLMCVLPPMAVTEQLGPVGAEEIHEYAYLYTYDSRKRMVGKKLPGADWITYAYDRDGRLVLTQDGNQRQNGRWSFRLEDAFGREAVTGTGSGSMPDISGVSVYATTDMQQAEGYGMPACLQGCQTHTASYYDSYGFLALLPPGVADSLAYTTAAGYSEQGTNTVGRLTGRRVYSLDGTGACMTHAYYYDNRNRLIQAHSTSHLGGYEHDCYRLSYTGNEEKHRHVHTAQGKPAVAEVYDRTYDHAGRLLTTTHTLNSGAPVVLASNGYDDLGRLNSSTPAGNNNLKMQYAYNVRSWVKSLSSPLFSETLLYEDGATPCWAGNISSIVWDADTVARRYDFTYDGLSRLVEAEYGEEHGQNAGRFSASCSYDKQGNITEICRYGYTNSLPNPGGGSPVYYYGVLDNLTLTYRGNRLQNVSDSSPAGLHQSFTDGFNSAEEYAYDANGNLSRDLNKAVTAITYNTLNLPDSISSTTGSTIKYTYGADGVKRRVRYETANMGIVMTAADAGGAAQAEGLPGIVEPIPQPLATTTMDYCGSTVYENGVLTMLLFDGGYVSFTRTGTGTNTTYTPAYHFYMRDHLGSNRVVVSAAGVPEQAMHYYPYGSTFYGETASAHRYRFCGKELDKMHALDWYDSGARHYDHVLGRFQQMDPMCEKYYDWSPYAYCGGNPVNAVDPYGSKIIFINGKIGGGSPPAGESYWGGKFSSFVLNAQKVLNDNNIIFYNQDHKYLSKAWEREKEGFEWAKSHFSLITDNMAEDESVKIISHSMGGAFGKGVERFLKINGLEVEYNIMLNTYQIDRINNDDDNNTFYIDYKNTYDPVLYNFDANEGKGELKNADIIIRQPAIDTFILYIHRFPIDNGKSFWDYMDFLINTDKTN